MNGMNPVLETLGNYDIDAGDHYFWNFYQNSWFKWATSCELDGVTRQSFHEDVKNAQEAANQ